MIEKQRAQLGGWLSKWTEPQVLLSVLAMFAAVVMALITTGIAIYQWNMKLEGKIERTEATAKRNEGELNVLKEQQREGSRALVRAVEQQGDRLDKRLSVIEDKMIRVEEKLGNLAELQTGYAEELKKHEAKDAHQSAEARIRANSDMSRERHNSQQRQIRDLEGWLRDLERSIPRDSGRPDQ